MQNETKDRHRLFVALYDAGKGKEPYWELAVIPKSSMAPMLWHPPPQSRNGHLVPGDYSPRMVEGGAYTVFSIVRNAFIDQRTGQVMDWQVQQRNVKKPEDEPSLICMVLIAKVVRSKIGLLQKIIPNTNVPPAGSGANADGWHPCSWIEGVISALCDHDPQIIDHAAVMMEGANDLYECDGQSALLLIPRAENQQQTNIHIRKVYLCD
ncbi:uncharacterized protein EI90DRAFT_3115028 [Cantharellus anzutake]|uniref:uncharacterized protein n=1 Tax=Cantharellus anzutake TaxID=1750568 RepID=UPI0019040DD6|nr:uncharacterized protein EI90DRAFT_3115028 [Cantharellus anzutake]KAF8344280.1 hypothetical protein EI90DRAFT_3115028 [Cantharellus anzutake]